KEKVDYEEYGGGILLGLPKVVVLAHGRSSALALRNAIHLALRSSKIDLAELIKETFRT
ncbi:MAG TPA: phosphate--acyl-ACP acyltransferase, partial [bacterium (Candidatus Stahlbacteria)]|nr:phosphate--acyl-ACP acyltransferase [Candidatus Stahlbacteria bacterium]